MIIPHSKYLQNTNLSIHSFDSGKILALNDRPSRALVCQNIDLSQSCHLFISDLEKQFLGMASALRSDSYVGPHVHKAMLTQGGEKSNSLPLVWFLSVPHVHQKMII